MPPTSPPSSEEQNNEGFPAPTDSDVHILYEIVQAAEASPSVDSLPFRALFSAYDQVLARHGISTSHDRIYLRFLFKLGELRQPGESMYAAFEALLARLGIVIQHSDDEDNELETTEAEEGTDDFIENTDVEARQPRSRRASFSSFIQYEEDTKERTRADSRSSLSRLQDCSSRLGAALHGKPKRFKEITRPQLARQADVQPPKPKPANTELPKARSKLREYNLLSVKNQGPPLSTERLQKSQRKQISHDYNHRSTRDVHIYEDPITEEDLFSAASSMLRASASDLTIPLEFDYRPSETQQIRDADIFADFRTRDLMRKTLWKWRDLAMQARGEHKFDDRKAVNYDQRLLAWKILEKWQLVYRHTQHARETERSYEKMEKQAVSYNNTKLLRIAFVHWANCAADEQERVTVARRHMIRMRYFNAWREMTAVNELKVRRHGLQKFMSIWNQRLVAAKVHEKTAVTAYQQNLVKTMYWRWFWTFCGERAPEWRHARLKRQSLLKWIDAARASMERATRMKALREDEIKRRALRTWIQEQKRLQQTQHEALQFQHRHTVSRALPAWQLQMKHAPLAREVTGMVNWRLVATAYSRMATIMNLELEAERINRLRIIRNAWTQWNDRLRLQTLQHQIDDRLAVQALYKWVLAERGVLLRRLNNERLQQKILHTFMAKWQAGKARTNESLAAVVSSQTQKTTKKVWDAWRAKRRFHEEQSQQALAIYTPLATQRAMLAWHASYEHNTQLERWSKEAVFYVRASRSLKAWRTAASKSKKQKLRDAYAQMRRIIKMDLAHRIIEKWHEKTAHIADLIETSRSIARERLMDSGIDILLHWQNRLANTQSLTPVAIDQRHLRLLDSNFKTWKSRFETANDNHIQSTSFDKSHVQKTAYEAFRRLQLRVLERQSLEAKASTVFAWNEKRSDKRLISACLRLWCDRAQQKRSPSSPSRILALTPRSARSAKSRLPLRSLQTMTHTVDLPDRSRPAAADIEVADWIPPFPAESQPVAVTPLPAYLSTPSKRAARARALVGGSFTPATANPPPQIVAVPEAPPAEEETPRRRRRETPLTRTLFQHTGRGVERPATDSRVRFEERRELDLGQSIVATRGPRRSLFAPREAGRVEDFGTDDGDGDV